MAEPSDRWENDKSASASAPAGSRAVFAAMAAFVVVFGLIAGWQWWRISTLKGELSTLKELAKAAKLNDVLLAEIIKSNQKTMNNQFTTLSRGLEKKIVRSASEQLDRSLAEAIGKLSAFGNTNFAFQMVEYDRRSCAAGGRFTGEHLDGEQQEEQFDAGAMVEVLPSHRDIKGIPFYRVSIDEAPLQWQDSNAEFRHGSMRIACN